MTSNVDEDEIAAKRAARAKKKEDAEREENDAVGVNHSLRYEFSRHIIEIEEDWSGDGINALAGLQWAGGVALARYFDDRNEFPEEYFHGKRILELGAGCGLTSVLLALLGAYVEVTDLDVEKAVPNFEANVPPDVISERVRLTKVDWFHPEPENFHLPYDAIVAGDCLYNAEIVVPLLNTMWQFSTEETAIYFCGIVSEPAFQMFNAHVGDYFQVEHLEWESPTVHCRAQDQGGEKEIRPEIEGASAGRGPVFAESRHSRALLRLHRRREKAQARVVDTHTPETAADTPETKAS